MTKERFKAEATNMASGGARGKVAPLWAVREATKGGAYSRFLGTKREAEAVAKVLNDLT